MNATEALRQCIEAMKLVDFKDCAESEALWKKLNDAQANAERVLRDGRDKVLLADEVIAALDALHEGCNEQSWTGWQNGHGEEVGDRLERAVQAYKAAHVLREGEKQEPVGWMADTPHGKIFSDEKAQPGTARYYWDWVPLYTHPAPSLQSVVEVPEGWHLVPIEPTSSMIDEVGQAIRANSGEGTDLELQGDAHSAYSAMIKYAPAPQPPAAPWESFSVEKTGDEHHDASNFLLNAAKEWWYASRQANVHGAVKWLDSEEGELLIYTRAEYRDALLENIHKLGQEPIRFTPATAPSGDVEREKVLREAAEIAWQYHAASNLTQEEMRVVAGIKNAILAAITATKE